MNPFKSNFYKSTSNSDPKNSQNPPATASVSETGGGDPEQTAVSRETILSGGTVSEMFHLFRDNGMSRHESLFNALYLFCHNRYEAAPQKRKNIFKRIPEHPLGWSGDMQKVNKHNLWSIFLHVLDGAAVIAHGVKRVQQALGRMIHKTARIPHSMDNSTRAIKAFFRVIRKSLLPCAAVALTFFTFLQIYHGMTVHYAVDVYIDGEYVGNTLNVNEILATKRGYEADLSVRYGTPVVLECDMSYVPSIYENKEKIASGDTDIYARYMSRFTENGYGFYVDGKLAGVSTTEKWFYDAISDYIAMQQANYRAEAGISEDEQVERFIYNNNMTIIADKFPHSYFLSRAEVRRLFSLSSALSAEEEEWFHEHLHFIDWDHFDGGATSTMTYSLDLNYPTTTEGSSNTNDLSVYNMTTPTQNVTVGLSMVREETGIEPIVYDIQTIEDETLREGTRRLVQNGKNGEKRVIYNAYYQNGEQTGRDIIGEEILRAPVDKIVRVGTRPLTEEEKNCVPTGTYIFPYEGKITSYFGWRVMSGSNTFHQGIDIWGKRGEAVVAADGGEVIEVGENRSYGKYCLIRHNEDVITRYAHCDTITVETGELVAQGSPIGTLGATGNATGVHVHFEYIENGIKVDPMPHMTGSLPFVAV